MIEKAQGFILGDWVDRRVSRQTAKDFFSSGAHVFPEHEKPVYIDMTPTALGKGPRLPAIPVSGTTPAKSRRSSLWENHEQLATLFDDWEVANRNDLFSVVGLKKFNYIANSDFHERRHLLSWKTLLRCEKMLSRLRPPSERMSRFRYFCAVVEKSGCDLRPQKRNDGRCFQALCRFV